MRGTKFTGPIILTILVLSSTGAMRVSEVRKLKVGKAPTYAAISPDGSRLFVTNFASDEISVIDTANRSEKRFYGGNEPLGIVVTPAGDKILVTNRRNGLVKVIDAHTYEILDDIKVGGMPSNIAVSPKGFEAFVTNYGRGKIGRIDFIDTSSHRHKGELEIGVRPLAAAVSALGDRLFVVCGGSNDLYVIDTSGPEIIKQLPVGLAPDALAVSPDGSTLYVSNSGTDDISVVDLLDLVEVKRVRVGSKPFSLAVDSSGSLFVVETGNNSLSILSSKLEKITSIKVGGKPIDVVLSPDSRHAYVTAERANRVFVYEVSH